MLFFGKSSFNKTIRINGNEEFSGGGHLQEIQSKADPSVFYPFVVDSIVPDDMPGTIIICEIQPAFTSVLPDDIKNLMLTTFEGKLSAGGEILYLNPRAGIITGTVDFHSDKVKMINASYLDEPASHTNSIVLITEGVRRLNSQGIKARYKEVTSLTHETSYMIFTEKILQRIVISMSTPELNPDCWFAFSIDAPPSIADINKAFPNGYIIKASSGTRGKQISTTKFKSDEQLCIYLKSTERAFFVIETFVKGTQLYRKKKHSAQRRLYCTHIDNETVLHGVQDMLAPVSYEDKSTDPDLQRVCHSKDGQKRIELRPKLDAEFKASSQRRMTKLMRDIEQVDNIKLLKFLLTHPNIVYQKLAVSLIAKTEKTCICMNFFYPIEYCQLIGTHVDKFIQLLDTQERKTLVATFKSAQISFDETDWMQIAKITNGQIDLDATAKANKAALNQLVQQSQALDPDNSPSSPHTV